MRHTSAPLKNIYITYSRAVVNNGKYEVSKERKVDFCHNISTGVNHALAYWKCHAKGIEKFREHV